ncbi:MAG: hypothetical protein R3324_01240 [Halobacteriales archaeon]|nr:hypothetical protein [Halobacteriales archaeon]
MRTQTTTLPTRATLVSLALSVLTAASAPAAITAIDAKPAATLLLPFFAVDTSSSGSSTFPGEREAPFQGINTVATIHNASGQRVIAHGVLWTDWGVPTISFNVGLQPHGTRELNLHHILEGRLPSLDGFGDLPDCESGNDPDAIYRDLTPEEVIAAHTGQASAGDQCFGADHGDGKARGYLTIDVVRSCTLQVPGEPGYFVSGGQGVAQNDNVLFGEYLLIDPQDEVAHGESLVHIEADAADPETAVPGEYTFYGSKLSPKWTASDNREVLATNWSSRYSVAGIFDSTRLIVWRDTREESPNPRSCDSSPSWFPLGQEQIVVFDEDMNPVVPVQGEPYPIASHPFPLATQMVDVAGDVGTSFSAGWMFLNLNQGDSDTGTGPTEDPDARQAYVAILPSSSGRFRTGAQAVALDNAANAQHNH